jgi:hypothetical protein
VQEWAANFAKDKLLPLAVDAPEWLQEMITKKDGGRMEAAYQVAKKQERGVTVANLRKEIIEAVVMAVDREMSEDSDPIALTHVRL